MQEKQETQASSLDLAQEDPLEEGMATHSRILAWRIPWTVSMDRDCPVDRETWRAAKRQTKQAGLSTHARY